MRGERLPADRPLAVHPATGSEPIVGFGEMVKPVREFDWASTPVGPLDAWTETLVSHVNLLLCSPLPAVLGWGSELTFVYNDTAIPTLGERHPQALGESYRSIFADVWHLIGGDLEACLQRGESRVRENRRIPLSGPDGTEQDGYYTYALVPVYEEGERVGVYCPYQNTTEAVVAARQLKALADSRSFLLDLTDKQSLATGAREIMQISAESLGRYLECRAKNLQMPCCVGYTSSCTTTRSGSGYELSNDPAIPCYMALSYASTKGDPSKTARWRGESR